MIKKSAKKRVVKKSVRKKPVAKKKKVAPKKSASRIANWPSNKYKEKFRVAFQDKDKSNLHSAKSQPGVEFQDNLNLPHLYNESFLRLIARDPHCIYLYWEISSSSIDSIQKNIGDEINQAKHILRINEVSLIEFNGTNANHRFDIEIGPFANSWYIHLPSDKGSYCAQLGLQTRDGQFHQIAQSNFITTPRSVLSHRSELIWMEVKDNEKASAYLEYRSKKSNMKKRRIYLTDEEVQLYFSQHYSRLRDILSKRFSQEELDEIFSSPDTTTTTSSLDDILGGKLSHQQYLKEVHSSSS